MQSPGGLFAGYQKSMAILRIGASSAGLSLLKGCTVSLVSFFTSVRSSNTNHMYLPKGVSSRQCNSSFHCRNHHMATINRIKAVLAEKQLTSKWLAEQLGKSENTISKWCSNKVQPSLENLVGIAKILDVDVRELIMSTKESR